MSVRDGRKLFDDEQPASRRKPREPLTLPPMATAMDRGRARARADRGDPAAKEAVRRHTAELADPTITGWTDDGQPSYDVQED